MIRSARLVSVLALLPLAGCSFDLSVPDNTARGSLVGRVDTQGRASPDGIDVRLTSAQGAKSTQPTSGGGDFLFGDLAPGVYLLDVQRDGFAPFVLPGLVVTKGGTTDAGVLSLSWLAGTPAEATLVGKVVAEGGGNVEGARVECILSQSQQRVALATVDGDGVFTERLPPGRYLLRASHPLYSQDERRDVDLREGQVLDLSANPLSLRLNPARLTGRVLAEVDGVAQPRPQAGVNVVVETGEATVTNAQGEFSFMALRAGQRQLRFSRADFADATATVTLAAGQSSTLPDVRLALRRGEIRGAVRLSDDAVVQDVTVMLEGTAYATAATPDTQPGQGSFRLMNVPNGTYTVVATKQRYGRAQATNVVVSDTSPVAVTPTLELNVLVGAFSIDDKDARSQGDTTRSRDVFLRLDSFAGASHYRVTEDAGFSSEPWLPFAAVEQPYTLTGGEGRITVRAQYRRAGVESAVAESSVVYDATPPSQASLEVAEGRPFTNQASALPLRLNAVDVGAAMTEVSGLSRVRLNLTGALEPDGGLLVDDFGRAFTRDLSLAVPPRPDGPITVQAQFLDRAGNASPVVAGTVTLDTQAPSGLTFRIRDGARATAPGFTDTPFVTLEHSAAPEPDGGFIRLQVSNASAALAGLPGFSLVPESPHVLDSSGAELKTVFARFVDAAGNTSPVVQAQVTLDTTPPGPTSASLVGPSPTADASVVLSLSAFDSQGLSPDAGVTLAEDLLFQRGRVGPFAFPDGGLAPFTLSGADGPKEVFVRFTDKAGNAAVQSVSVVLDRSAPSAALSLLGQLADGTPSTQRSAVAQVQARIDAPDAVAMAVAEAPLSCATASYEPRAATKSVTLSAEGTRTVELCVKDAAGNVTGPIAASITLDSTAPTGCSLTVRGSRRDGSGAAPDGSTAAPTVLASVSCPGSGLEVALVAGAVTCSSTAQLDYRPLGADVPLTLVGPDGLFAVQGCVRDASRNVAPLAGAAITLDSTPPTSTQLLLLKPDGGQLSATLNAQDVAAAGLRVLAEGQAVGATQWAVAVGANPLVSALSPFTASPSRQLVTFPSDGTHVVSAVFRDALGNESERLSAAVAFDVTAPVGGAVRVAGGSTVVNRESIGLEFDVPSDAVRMQVVEAALCPTTAFTTPLIPATASLTFLLSPVSGAKTVCARFFDAAGNPSSPPAQVSFSLDTSAPTLQLDVLGLDGGLNPAATRARDVRLVLTTSAEATGYFVSNAPAQCAQVTSWTTPDGGAVPFTLLDAPGVQFAHACVRDAAGNTNSAARAITYDAVPPSGATLRVGNGAAVQTSGPFAMTFAGVSDDVTHMALAVDTPLDCQTATYEAFVNNSPRVLSNGSHQVRACLRDVAWNTAALGPVSVVVDAVAPVLGGLTVSGLSRPDAGLTNTFALDVGLVGASDALSGIESVRLSADPTFAEATVYPYDALDAGPYRFTLPPGDGLKTVYVRLRDGAGNLSEPPRTFSLTLDTQRPTFVQPPQAVQPYVTKALMGPTPVAFSLAAADSSDTPSQLRVGLALSAAACATAPLVDFTSPLTLDVAAAAPGLVVPYLCVVDRAGNRSDPVAAPVQLINPPSSSLLQPSLPAPLASGAFVSWGDSNAHTRLIEVEAAPNAAFDGGVLRYQAALGSCAASGVTPPPTSARLGLEPGMTPLTNLATWHLRLRAVDCAGAATPFVDFPATVIPNLVRTTVPFAQTSLRLDAVADELWLHGIDPSALGRVERVWRCAPSVADCRQEASWAGFSVSLDSRPSASGAPASLFTVDGRVFLTDSVADTSTTALAVASCARGADCSQVASWSSAVVLSSSCMFCSNPLRSVRSPVAAAGPGGAMIAFVATRDVGTWLEVLRCTSGESGGGCDPSSGTWRHVSTALEVANQALTVTADEGSFWIGAVSSEAAGDPSTGPTAAGQPLLIRTGFGLDGGTTQDVACNGGPTCGCDGGSCQDFTFSRLASAAVGETLSAEAPQVRVVGGRIHALWGERRCVGPNCTDAIRARACPGGACRSASQFDPPTTVVQRLMLSSGDPVPPFALSSGSVQELSEPLRVIYADGTQTQLQVTSCQHASDGGCFGEAQTVTLSEGGVALAGPSTLVTRGKDLYFAGAPELGNVVLFQPALPSPRVLTVLPSGSGLEARWTTASGVARSVLRHQPTGGGPVTVVDIPDPFTSSFGISGAARRSVSLAFAGPSGLSESSTVWTAERFTSTATLPVQSHVPLTFSAPGGEGSNTYVYAAMARLAVDPGVYLGRCNTAGDCRLSGAWTWNKVLSGTGFSQLQLGVDYPRNPLTGAKVSDQARLFVLAVQGSSDLTVRVLGCVLPASGATGCAAEADFSTAVGPIVWTGAGGRQASLKVVGERVQLTASLRGAFADEAVVRFCDAVPYGAGLSCSTAPALQLSHCLSAANWTGPITLADGTITVSSTHAVGLPHPTAGFFAAASTGTGLLQWHCPYAAPGCPSVRNDCSQPTAWVFSQINTGGPVSHLDAVASQGPAFAAAASTPSNAGLYVSYRQGQNWGVAACKGAAGAAFEPWHCARTNGALSEGQRSAVGWSTAQVLPFISGTPAGSTLRLVGGDLFAAFSMSSRHFVARCAGARDCLRADRWTVFSVSNTPSGFGATGSLAGGVGGELYLGTTAPDGVPQLLTGGFVSTR